jgi:hypothetical protein
MPAKKICLTNNWTYSFVLQLPTQVSWYPLDEVTTRLRCSESKSQFMVAASVVLAQHSVRQKQGQ